MKNLLTDAYLKAKFGLKKLATEEKGASEVIAIVIILAVIVAIAFAFGKNITDMFNKLWAWVSGNATNGQNNVGTPTGGTPAGGSGGASGGIILFLKSL